MNLVELDRLTAEQRAELTGGELGPFSGEHLGLHWREKDRYVVLHSCDGRTLAAAGLVTVDAEIDGRQVFAVAGLGDVVVTPDHRGQGLARVVVEAAARSAKEMGADLMMLFCAPGLVGLYEHLGFAEIAAPVRVEQPAGSLQMSMRAMWCALREGAVWPAGPVALHSLPF
jgi:GNAT superfamily N-acetyltransferase